MTERNPTSDVAADVRADLFEHFIEASRQMRQFFDEHVGSLGLTPPQAHALHLFSRPRPMGSAAEAMRCDASYITHIADDLESLGLAARSTDPGDRRIKQMTLTPRGRALHEQLQDLLYRGNPLAANLDSDDQHTLARLLGKLPPASPAE